MSGSVDDVPCMNFEANIFAKSLCQGVNLMGFWAPDTLIQHDPLRQDWTHKLLGCL
uniref:Uncharacterized protein n=1 Tax=Geospiza parvula TaxID=87175 RepID=A0A8U8BED1_GEOPR